MVYRDFSWSLEFLATSKKQQKRPLEAEQKNSRTLPPQKTTKFCSVHQADHCASCNVGIPWLDWLDVASAVSGTQMPWKNMKQLGWLAQHRKGSFYELYYVDSGCIGIIFVGICLFVIVCGGKQKLHKQASFRNTSWPSSIDMSALFFLQGLGFDQMTHAFWKHITRATLSIAVVITVPQNIHPHTFLYPFKSRVSLWLQK